MDFSSLLRKTRNSRRKTFSISNLSSISSSSTSVGRKTIRLTLPEDFGAEIGVDGKVLGLVRKGPSHASGVLQVGDYVRVLEAEEEASEREKGMISLHVTYGVLQPDQRPESPFMIEIGNRSRTSLGLALTDTPGNQIRISSIQPGSLAERCGFLRPGDILSSIHVGSSETISCSPYYMSYQIAQILRKLASRNSSVTLTVLPHLGHHRSGFKELLWRNKSPPEDDNSSSASTITITEDQPAMKNENNQCIMTLCLWKDRLYEDWGFSLIDAEEEDGAHISLRNQGQGANVHQIRPGGPAFLAGLSRGDKILQINERDVSSLESTILVPILASLDDALNLVILRDQS